MASVDVAIPCYNYARFLPQCIRSVLSQGVADLRIIFIDNASTDDSVAVARKMAQEDSRIEVICHDRNLGTHASFNEAIDRARADYFLILCADDVLTDGALRHAIEILERSPQANFALGAEVKIVAEGEFDVPTQPKGWRILDSDTFIERCCLGLGFSWGLGAILVRTATQKNVGHYRDTLPYTDDLEMILRLGRTGSLIEMEGALCIRREHSLQVSNSWFSSESVRLREREAAFNSFFEQEGADVLQASHLRQIVRTRLAEAAFRTSASHLLKGLVSSSSSLLKYGLGLAPEMLLPLLFRVARRKDALRVASAAVFRQGKPPA